ncbi:MAG: alpha/beta hydrolase [Calditrichaeota bacterium]|nr:alpha/beta hydrolase [Calditrichota bacterium]
MTDFLVRKLIYPVPWINVPSPPPAPLKEMKLPVSGNDFIHVWYHTDDSLRPFIIYLHGNGENLETLWLSGIYKQFIDMKINFFVPDYPGYGNSSGKPGEKNIIEAVSELLKWVREHYPENPLILAGWSLGASVAIIVGADHQKDLKGIMAISPWISLQEVASEHYPDWLVKLFLREKYDSAAALRDTDIPVLLIHGAQDDVIPVTHGRELSRLRGNSVRYLEIPMAGHSDLFSHPRFWSEFMHFIEAP